MTSTNGYLPDGSLDTAWPHGFECGNRKAQFLARDPDSKDKLVWKLTDAEGQFFYSPSEANGKRPGAAAVVPRPAPSSLVVSDEAVKAYCLAWQVHGGTTTMGLRSALPILLRDNTKEAREALSEMLKEFGNPTREEYVQAAGFEDALRVVARARAALAAMGNAFA